MSKRSLADLAQLVEHLIRNEGVVGSNPIVGTIYLNEIKMLARPRRALQAPKTA